MNIFLQCFGGWMSWEKFGTFERSASIVDSLPGPRWWYENSTGCTILVSRPLDDNKETKYSNLLVWYRTLIKSIVSTQMVSVGALHGTLYMKHTKCGTCNPCPTIRKGKEKYVLKMLTHCTECRSWFWWPESGLHLVAGCKNYSAWCENTCLCSL